MDALKSRIEESGGTVTHDALPAVQAHRTHVRQLFQNLIGNALKFRGERPPIIHVGAEREGDCWRFSVRDNGIGIAPEYQHKVF